MNLKRYKKHDVFFHLGLNTNTNKRFLKDGECSVAQDCYFDEIGNIFSRKFKKSYISFPYQKVKSIFPYNNLVLNVDGHLYDGHKLILSSIGSNPLSCVEYNGFLYLANGTVAKMYNGTDDYLIGVVAPANKPAVADSGSGGNPDGTYYYKYTYLRTVDGVNVESSASPSSDAITVNTNQIEITVAASADGEVDNIVLYRLGGTLSDWYKVGSYSNQNATITDNNADSSLTDLFDADVNDPPPTVYYFGLHYERLIAARDDTYENAIYYSKAYYPEYFGDPNTNQQYLIGDSDECKGLLPWGRYVCFFKKDKIYVMEGTDPTNWHKRRSDSRHGNIAPYCLEFWKAPIFCSYDGLYFFDITREYKFSDKIEPFFKDNSGYLEEAVAAIYDNKYFFGLKDKTLVYDLLNKTFSIYNFGLTAISYDFRYNILYGGIEGDGVVKLEQDDNGDSESISFQIKSKSIKLGDAYFGKLRNFQVMINTDSEDVTLNVYIDDNLKQSITLNTKAMQTVRKSFDSKLSGEYAEFEFVYSGTKSIEIAPPLTINPEY